MNVHFVCRGNVLRSLIAETYLKSLNINCIRVISSGTNVDWNDPMERKYFANTLRVLDRHGIKSYAKTEPDQLTPERADGDYDLVVFMNQRVIDEAMKIIEIPTNAQNWEIVDIGEGHRTHVENREPYEEEIFQEIVQKINELFLVDK